MTLFTAPRTLPLFALVLLLSACGPTADPQKRAQPATPAGPVATGAGSPEQLDPTPRPDPMPATSSTPASVATCGSVADYCKSNLCVPSYVQGQDPKNWCHPGSTLDIFVSTGVCKNGSYHAVVRAGAAFWDNIYFIYDSSDKLVSVFSVDEGGSRCLAGESAMATANMNCPFEQPTECIDGAIK